jgi:hypothetical protein
MCHNEYTGSCIHVKMTRPTKHDNGMLIQLLTVLTLPIIQFSDLKQHSRDWIVPPSSASRPTQLGSIDRASLYLQKVSNKKPDQ